MQYLIKPALYPFNHRVTLSHVTFLTSAIHIMGILIDTEALSKFFSVFKSQSLKTTKQWNIMNDLTYSKLFFVKSIINVTYMFICVEECLLSWYNIDISAWAESTISRVYRILTFITNREYTSLWSAGGQHGYSPDMHNYNTVLMVHMHHIVWRTDCLLLAVSVCRMIA